VRCTKGRTQHDIAHITTSTTAHCTTSSDITTRRHGVSPRFHNFDSFCFQPLQTADRLAQSGVATKLRFRFESLRNVLTWVGDAWRRAVGHILTWVGDAWRRAVGHILTWVGDAWRCTWRDAGVTERDVPAADGTKLAAEERIGVKSPVSGFSGRATKRYCLCVQSSKSIKRCFDRSIGMFDIRHYICYICGNVLVWITLMKRSVDRGRVGWLHSNTAATGRKFRYFGN
jgi:hypothetical protein